MLSTAERTLTDVDGLMGLIRELHPDVVTASTANTDAEYLDAAELHRWGITSATFGDAIASLTPEYLGGYLKELRRRPWADGRPQFAQHSPFWEGWTEATPAPVTDC